MSAWLEDVTDDHDKNRDFKQFISNMRSLLDEPDKWTKHKLCTTQKGKGVPIDSPYAKCYCIMGAMQRTMSNGNFHYSVAETFFVKSEKMIERGIVSWNDDPKTTHEMVIGLLDGLQTAA